MHGLKERPSSSSSSGGGCYLDDVMGTCMPPRCRPHINDLMTQTDRPTDTDREKDGHIQVDGQVERVRHMTQRETLCTMTHGGDHSAA